MAWWALKQYFAAREIAKRYNEHIAKVEPPPKLSLWQSLHEWFTELPKHTARRGDGHVQPWTETHKSKRPTRRKKARKELEAQKPFIQPWTEMRGFFVQMGGFMLYEDAYPAQVITFDVMCARIKAKEIDAPTATEAEIQDRSKGNALSKGVVVLQTSWFVVQCLARVLGGLPLSELEVVTLGFVDLNGIVYAVWWNKPLGVGVAIPVPLKRKNTQARARGRPKSRRDNYIPLETQDSTVYGIDMTQNHQSTIQRAAYLHRSLA